MQSDSLRSYLFYLTGQGCVYYGFDDPTLTPIDSAYCGDSLLATSVSFTSRGDKYVVFQRNPTEYPISSIYLSRRDISTEVREREPSLPVRFSIMSAPNPFNSQTKIYINLPVPSTPELQIYNLLGQLVERITLGRLQSGVHTVYFTGDNLSSGTYLVVLQDGKSMSTTKLLLMK